MISELQLIDVWMLSLGRNNNWQKKESKPYKEKQGKLVPLMTE